MVKVSQSREYIVDNDGNFRFTKVGLVEQAPLLAKAGIDAKSIKTYVEYLQARKASQPFFMEYLQEGINDRLSDKPDSLERQAIHSLVFGTEEEQQKIIKKLELKQSFKIV